MLDKPVSVIDQALLARFAAIVGEKFAITDPQAQLPYLLEMRDLYRGRSPLVLRPGSTAEVAEILRLANETLTPVVPQGGNTGLVGGQTPHNNEIVLSLNRLDRIREIDPGLEHDHLRSRSDAAAGARSRRRCRPALSAVAAVGRYLHHWRQSLDQRRRHRRACLRRRAIARARTRSGAGRRPHSQQPQQAEKRQYRLRSEKPVHRRRRNAGRHHRCGAAAAAAPPFRRNRHCRAGVAAGRPRPARHRHATRRRQRDQLRTDVTRRPGTGAPPRRRLPRSAAGTASLVRADRTVRAKPNTDCGT